MFTGLVEETAPLLALELTATGGRLWLAAPGICPGTRVGDSVAVNGCCLTVTQIDGEQLAFDLLGETLARTNLGDLAPGALVNLERALPANGRLGGHFVQGHIDCTSPVLAFEPRGDDWRLEIALPDAYARYVVEKGSIAVDGVSLTVAEVGEASLVLWIIPHTLAATRLGALAPGARVNLEFDLLAKYLERLQQVEKR